MNTGPITRPQRVGYAVVLACLLVAYGCLGAVGVVSVYVIATGG